MQFWFRFFSLLCCFGSLHSGEPAKDKLYLQEGQFAIHGSQFFVFVENQWEPTEALFSDKNGIYILARKWYEPWDCSYCGVTNPPHRLTCWNCGR